MYEEHLYTIRTLAVLAVELLHDILHGDYGYTDDVRLTADVLADHINKHSYSPTD